MTPPMTTKGSTCKPVVPTMSAISRMLHSGIFMLAPVAVAMPTAKPASGDNPGKTSAARVPRSPPSKIVGKMGPPRKPPPSETLHALDRFQPIAMV